MITGKNIPKKIKPLHIGFFIFFIVLFVGISFIPVSIDYDHYISTTRAWLSNDTRLYDNHSNSFYYMPWSLYITAPLSALPDRYGQALLNVISLIGIILSLLLISKKVPWWGTFFVLANLFTINLLFSAQWDGLVLGAIGLCWWSIEEKKPLGVGIALTIMSTKPTNVYFIIVLIVIYVILKWEKLSIIKTAVIPFIAGISSLLISGIDWPLRYLKYISVNPPPPEYNLSFWHQPNFLTLLGAILALVIMMIIWFVMINLRNHPLDNGVVIIFALLVNLLVSNYVLSYHYIYTIPALGWLSKKSWFFSLCVYGVMISYILGLANLIVTPPYFVYPLLIFIFCLIVLLREINNYYPKKKNE